MKGLINILEQEIDWGGGVSIPGTVSDTIDTGSSWSDILNGRDTQTNNGSQDTESTLLDRILSGEVGGNSLFGPNNDRSVTDPRYGWTIKKRSDDETMMSNYAEAIQSAINVTSEDDEILDSITIEELEGGGERLVLTGQTKKGIHHLYPLEKKGGEWGWVDDADHEGNVLPDEEHKWYKFSQY